VNRRIPEERRIWPRAQKTHQECNPRSSPNLRRLRCRPPQRHL